MNPPSVRIATAADRDSVLDTLVLAFASDPCARYTWPNPRGFMAAWRIFAMGMGGRAFDHSTAFISEDGGGAALWLPSGVESDSEALEKLMGETVAEEKHPVIGQVMEGMSGFHPHQPHWYLALVGVDPARQGEGLGSALIKRGLQLCDEQGLPAYLESSSPRNIPLYERHGFEVMGVVQPGDFPGAYPMYRAPRG